MNIRPDNFNPLHEISKIGQSITKSSLDFVNEAKMNLKESRNGLISAGKKLGENVLHHPQSSALTATKTVFKCNVLFAGFQAGKALGGAVLKGIFGSDKSSKSPDVGEHLDNAAISDVAVALKEASSNLGVENPSTQRATASVSKDKASETKTDAPVAQLKPTGAPESASATKIPESLSQEKKDEMIKKSPYIRKEIVTTEETFLANLNKGVEGVKLLKFMASEGIIDPKYETKLGEIQKDFEKAVKSSESLLKELKDSKNITNEGVGDIYLRNMDSYAESIAPLVVHNKFLSNINLEVQGKVSCKVVNGNIMNTPKEVAEIGKSANKLRDYVYLSKQSSGSKDQAESSFDDPADFLKEFDNSYVAGVQRMPRHIMLLEDLAKNTVGEDAKATVEKAAGKNKNLTIEINATVGKAQNLEMAENLEKTMNQLLQQKSQSGIRSLFLSSPQKKSEQFSKLLDGVSKLSDAKITKLVNGEKQDVFDKVALGKVEDMLGVIANDEGIQKMLGSNADLKIKFDELKEKCNINLREASLGD
jgi:hypothetical protein